MCYRKSFIVDTSRTHFLSISIFPRRTNLDQYKCSLVHRGGDKFWVNNADFSSLFSPLQPPVEHLRFLFLLIKAGDLWNHSVVSPSLCGWLMALKKKKKKNHGNGPSLWRKSSISSLAFCYLQIPWKMLAFAFKCPCSDKHVVQRAIYSAMTISE